jgi:hypothetical protein
MSVTIRVSMADDQDFTRHVAHDLIDLRLAHLAGLKGRSAAAVRQRDQPLRRSFPL